jgi:hypothetical protein
MPATPVIRTPTSTSTPAASPSHHMAAASGHPFVQEKRKKLATQLSSGGSNRPPARPAFAWAAQTSLPGEQCFD